MEIALIVAGGSGQRMQTDIPKQFIKINGLPVLMHTISAFRNYSIPIQIILVLPDNEIENWKALVSQFEFEDVNKIVSGGKTRFRSVQNGLKFVQENDLVAIHDGVRPMITKNIIRDNFLTAEKYGNAVTAVSIKDSLRKISQGISSSVDRNDFRIVQTPQTFKGDVILKAYKQDYKSSFTDDASVVENDGVRIHLVDGDYRNIKLTTSEDLESISISMRK